MADDELIALYNSQAPNVVIGLDFIARELTRREEERRMERMEKLSQQSATKVSELARLTKESARQTAAMVEMTQSIERFTKFIMVLTIVNVLAAAGGFLAAILG
jgi:hypothetical protein